ncbi:Receptor expression-enhancing protein [Dirofilaria immitis]|nr:Receptor expression-enhancing protein [Dirofilaria immitis]
MVLQLLSHAASIVIGALYPAFKTFKKRWLKYWTVYAGFLAADTIGDILLLPYIMPGYLLIKLSFLLWTASAWTDGALIVHQKLIAPLLTIYEQDIDEMLDNIGHSVQRQVSRIGNGALDKARLGLLSLATTDNSSIGYPLPTDRYVPVTVAVEEQAEEDIIRLVDEDTDIKRELEESGSNTYTDKDAKDRLHRSRRVRANRSISRGR